MSLQVTRDSLAGETGFYLGYNRDPSGFRLEQVLDVDAVLAKAMRAWYFPVVAGVLYRWSFLRKSGVLALVQDTVTYELPADFGGFVTEYINYREKALKAALCRRSEDTLLSQHTQAWITGDPKYFAVRSKGTLEGGRPLQEILVYPAPDSTNGGVEVTFRYMQIPPELSAQNPSPLGGEIHGETILEACLAMAEQKIEDAAGIHTAKFQQLLAASIAVDMDMAR